MRGLVLALLAALPAGCGPSVADSFRSDGFHHPDYAYRVGYEHPTERQLMAPEWRLDNFQLDDGKPDRFKDGPDYVYTAEFDSGSDGDVDATAELYLYDLRFEHQMHDGVIWMRTFPISRTDMRKELGILARNHLAAVAGVGVSVPVFENVAEGVADDLRVEQRRYGTRVLESVRAVVGRAQAFRVTFDVFNLDQMQVDPDTPARRMRIYFLRPPYTWEYPDGVARSGSARGRWPALMTIGYSNHADRFDDGLPAFEDMVGRLGFARGDYESGVRILEYVRSWNDGVPDDEEALADDPEWEGQGPGEPLPAEVEQPVASPPAEEDAAPSEEPTSQGSPAADPEASPSTEGGAETPAPSRDAH